MTHEYLASKWMPSFHSRNSLCVDYSRALGTEVSGSITDWLSLFLFPIIFSTIFPKEPLVYGIFFSGHVIMIFGIKFC